MCRGYAFEISHHILGKQAALLKSELYLNAEPVTIWLYGQGPQLAAQTPLEDLDPAKPLAVPPVAVVKHPATDDVLQQARKKATVAADCQARLL
jgi:hypothetical protein